MSEETKKRRLIKPFELVLLVVVVLVILVLGLKKLGVDLVQHSESLSFLDRPSGPEKPLSPRRNADQLAKEEAVIEKIAAQFTQDANDKTYTKVGVLEAKGLSADEARFYSDLQQREQDKNLTPTQWLNRVKYSFRTYRQLRSIFDQFDEATDGVVSNTAMRSMLGDMELSQQIFRQIEELFGVPAARLQVFASRGSTSLSDWATFIEQNRD